MVAASYGDINIVNELISAGSDVNLKTYRLTYRLTHKTSNSDELDIRDYKESPLACAVLYGHLNIVKKLISSGAHIDVSLTEEGITLLMVSSQYGYLEIFEELLANGADPNLQNKDGITALMLASEYGHFEIVEDLLTIVKVNPNVQNKEGWTAYTYASRNGHMDIAKDILAAEMKWQPNIYQERKDYIMHKLKRLVIILKFKCELLLFAIKTFYKFMINGFKEEK